MSLETVMHLYRALRMVSILGTVVLLAAAGAARGECAANDGTDSANARFVLQGDTVYDSETNLTWKRCSEGQRWDDAGGCVGEAELQIVEFDRKDPALSWRLPSLRELRSILAESCRNPAVDQTAFPNTVSGWYWTSMPPASRRWLLDFADGDVQLRQHACRREAGPLRALIRVCRGRNIASARRSAGAISARARIVSHRPAE
ncbi:MAG TPA: DUF1566 domain-containing protein [Burkholderiales bacterium]|nr:DUF1566 domain-containing protein [Burkholderiales bacterium]